MTPPNNSDLPELPPHPYKNDRWGVLEVEAITAYGEQCRAIGRAERDPVDQTPRAMCGVCFGDCFSGTNCDACGNTGYEK